jgi:hypothetical protein
MYTARNLLIRKRACLIRTLDFVILRDSEGSVGE